MLECLKSSPNYLDSHDPDMSTGLKHDEHAAVLYVLRLLTIVVHVKALQSGIEPCKRMVVGVMVGGVTAPALVTAHDVKDDSAKRILKCGHRAVDELL